MKKTSIFLATLFVIFFAFAANSQNISSSKDREIVEHIFSKLEAEKDKSCAELLVAAGKLLMGTPYVAHTLEGIPEVLTINLHELDCTTFAENCLAIARVIKKGNPSFKAFAKELTNIRYRNEEINAYPSRLHYFSDWIFENDKAERIKCVSKQIANTSYPLYVNFMSTHSESYSTLKSNPEFVSKLAEQERIISQRQMYFIPKQKIETHSSKLEEGDIVGITTSISGLDITHVGIVVKVNGETHLMHASSKAQKVIISENSLFEYLKGRESATGIMLARPL